jgi:RNA polymerase sigma-70 factor, ECF subfamily
MDERDWLAQRFDQERPHLEAVAFRMLGSRAEAEDAVQETWIRLSRADASAVENLGGWLTTVVGRVCLNVLRSRATRREDRLDPNPTESIAADDDRTDPEQEAILADSIGLALLVVLDTLSPSERVAFVLHDIFAVPFEEIAPIVDRSTTATRQLASRARRRVQGQDAIRDSDRYRQARLVDAFLAATRNGDFKALLAVLDPDIVLRADTQAAELGGAAQIRGAKAVATAFSRRARGARPALVDGAAGAVWMPAGKVRVVVTFTITGDKITAIYLIADPEHLREFDLELPTDHVGAAHGGR